MTRLNLKALVSAAVFAGLVACAAPGGDSKPDISATESAKPQLLVYDLKLGYRLDIVEAKSTMAGDLKKAQIKIKNDWHSELKFDYKVVWYDADGNEIDIEGEAWKPIITQSQQEITFTSLAPNATATDYIIHIRD